MNYKYYMIVLKLDKPQQIKIGELGLFEFKMGYYVYIGRAAKGIRARLSRHISLKKYKRWHIDYLSEKAMPVYTKLLASEYYFSECEIAKNVKKIGGEITDRFWSF
ncbi:GIY-YIG nuclease family protein [Natranaerobius trueperi]|uniref:Nuclease n=1 Tax=Natranaerobius trueperi TaxID=759412 RepID=A0A226BVA2_9FIRM|nr:GIY-YIG nuclease family protein [Natranaerobius trueperi]OWZ82905.1 nuclease [Natranaerobius trueperi]